jgi:hypothetical protein
MSDPFDSHRPAEQPRVEPEIIPPGDPGPGGFRGSTFRYTGPDQRTRVYSIGPFTVILCLIATALIAGLILLLIFGALLIWIPFAAIGIALVLSAALARGYWLRFRRWLGG